MSTSRGKGVRVRGTCAAGHTTETTSAPGRTTWEGECAQDGCELRVKARRVPVDRNPPAPAAKPPARPGDPYEVKEVRSYGRKRQPQPEREPEPKPDEGRRADVPPAEAGPVGDRGQPERPARGGRRLTFARGGGERAVTRREYRRPDFLEGIIGS